MKWVLLVLLIGLILIASGCSEITDKSGSKYFVDKDCSDFSTQTEAQAFFEANDPINGPHLLDDRDFIACEWNP